MSGAKRGSGYRKSIVAQTLEAFPEPDETEAIVRVSGMRGGNLVDVVFAASTSADESKNAEPTLTPALALLPAKFRRLVWIKRGDFLIVARGDADADEKVRFVVRQILQRAQVDHLRKRGLLPARLLDDDDDDRDAVRAVPADDFAADANPNRRHRRQPTKKRRDDDDDDDDDDD